MGSESLGFSSISVVLFAATGLVAAGISGYVLIDPSSDFTEQADSSANYSQCQTWKSQTQTAGIDETDQYERKYNNQCETTELDKQVREGNFYSQEYNESNHTSDYEEVTSQCKIGECRSQSVCVAEGDNIGESCGLGGTCCTLEDKQNIEYEESEGNAGDETENTRDESENTEDEPENVDFGPGFYPLNGYWYKGYFFEWSTVHQDGDPRQGKFEFTRELDRKLGEPQVLGTDVGNKDWTSIEGIRQGNLKIDELAEWANKNNGEDTYDADHRYVYYVSWLIPKTVRGEVGNEQGYRNAANGQYNEHYREFAQNIKEAGLADQVILRLAPEFNGDWQGYAGDSPQAYANALKEYVQTVRSVDDRIMFAYSPALNKEEDTVMQAYPGDQYIDYLGLSGPHDGHAGLYDENDYSVCDNSREYPDVSEQCAEKLWSDAWNYYKTSGFGLNDAEEFAQNHDLPMAFMEWGLQSNLKSKFDGTDMNNYAREHSGGDNARFVRSMCNWMKNHNVHFQTEFEALNKEHHLASGNVPDAMEAFRQTCGKGSSTDYIKKYKQGGYNSGEDTGSGEPSDHESGTGSNYIFLTEDDLSNVKQKVDSKQEPWESAYLELIEDADAAMGASPRSVTNYGPSSSRQYHLYGTQYGDGRADYTQVMIPMSERIRDLSMAYAYTGEDKYAQRAIEYIDYFMLDENTGMEPNVVHGGDKSFYPEPHITIPAAIYGASFLRGHSAWGTDGRPAESEMEEWVQQWRQSLIENVDNTGVSGIVDNNIFAWYIVDRMVSSAYLQEDNALQNDIELWKKGVPGDSDRVSAVNQIENQGGDIVLEHEIGRGSDGEYHYSIYGMKAMTLGAQIAYVRGKDLYTYQNENGYTLQDVYDWHAPYIENPLSWPDQYTQTRDLQSNQMEGAVSLEMANSRWPGRYSNELNGISPVYGNRVMGWTGLTNAD